MARKAPPNKNKQPPTPDGTGSGYAAPPLTQASMGQVYGDSGLRRSGGLVINDLNRRLAGQQGAIEYSRMSREFPVVSGVILAFTSMLRNARWSIVAPMEDDKEAKELQDFVTEYLNGINGGWAHFMASASSIFVHGYAPIETTFKRDPEGRIVPDRLDLRNQETITQWYFDDLGNPTSFMQATERGSFFVPVAKTMLLRTNSSMDNPVGQSLLRGAYQPWVFWKRFQEIQAIAVERDLTGLPVMRVPNAILSDPANAAVRAHYEQMVTSVRADERAGVVLPSDVYVDADGKPSSIRIYEFELMTAAGSRQHDTDGIIKHQETAAAMSMLGDFIVVGMNGSSAYSLAESKIELFTLALSSYLQIIEDAVNYSLIRQVWDFNGADPEKMPRFEFAPIELPDLEALGNYVNNLSAAGAPLFPDEDLENVLRSRAGLPEAPKDREDALVFGGMDEATLQARVTGAQNIDENMGDNGSVEEDEEDEADEVEEIAARFEERLQKTMSIMANMVKDEIGDLKTQMSEAQGKAAERLANAQAEKIERELADEAAAASLFDDDDEDDTEGDKKRPKPKDKGD